MPEGLNMVFVDREFNQAIEELAGESRRSDVQVLTGQAIQFVRRLVEHTRLALTKKGKSVWFRHKGRARAGWWPSWIALGAFSTPRGTSSRMLANGEGSFRDGRQGRGEIFVEMTNEVAYIDKLDRQDNILVRTGQDRFDDMQEAIVERYHRMLRRKSG